MENVDNMGFIIQQISPNESQTNWPFEQSGIQQVDSKIKYSIII